MSMVFDSLTRYAENWQVVNSRSFNAEEIAAVRKAEVVPSQYGNSVVFFMKSGGQTYIPLSRDSEKVVGDTIDLHEAKLLTLHRDGDDNIMRVQA